MASHIEFLTNYQTEDQKVRVAVTVLPAINLCLQRGGAAPIPSVTIHNDSDTALEDLDLEIRTSPELILPFTRHIDCIPAGKTVELSRPKVTMNAEMLAGLTEKSAFDSEKDCGFYNFDPASALACKLVPGNFAILCPEEGHMPCIECTDAPGTVKKVVVKVAI